MMKKFVIALAIAIILAMVIGLSQYRKSQHSIQVNTATVSSDILSDTILASGNLEFNTQIQIRSEITGKVIEVLVEEGQQVTQGQILMRLDPTMFEADVARTKAQVLSQEIDIQRAKAVLTDLQRQYKQQQKLFAASLVQQDTIDSLQNQLDIAQINIAAVQSALEQSKASQRIAEDNLSKTIYRAPISGLLATVDIKAGETVIAGSTNIIGSPLMTLADPSATLAEIRVDEADIANIQLGQRVEVYAASAPHQPIMGHISHIAASARSLNQSQSLFFRVKVLLETEGITTYPGMSCRAEIITAQQQETLQVPVAAIQQQGAQHFVWLLEGDRVSKRNVTLGMATDIAQEIITGLAANDVVITGPARAVSQLTNGSKVQPQPAGQQD